MKKLLKFDLHMHSQYSYDSKTTPKEIIQTSKKKGLNVIAITDHGTRQGGIETEKIAKGIQVIVGQEVLTKQGEFIVFNIDRDLEQKQDLVKSVKLAKKLGGFILVPHPFDPLRNGIGKNIHDIKKYVDCIEGFNPKCFFSRSNNKAEEFALENNIPAIAGSDAHKKQDIGLAHTTANNSDVFTAIKNNEVKMVKRGLGKRKIISRGLTRGIRK